MEPQKKTLGARLIIPAVTHCGRTISNTGPTRDVRRKSKEYDGQRHGARVVSVIIEWIPSLDSSSRPRLTNGTKVEADLPDIRGCASSIGEERRCAHRCLEASEDAPKLGFNVSRS